MNIKPPKSDRPVYFVRNDADAAERGPFALESLRDLAEFGHITPEILIRKESDPTPCSLHENPELLSEIFPERHHLHLGRYETETNTEDRFRPVGLTDARRCAPGEEEPAPDDSSDAAPPPRGSASGLHLDPERKNYEAVSETEAETSASEFSPKQSLQEISEKSRRDFTEPEDKETKTGPWLVFAARLTGTLIFAGFGLKLWTGMGGGATAVLVDFFLGAAMVALGLIFILPEVMAVVTAPFNGMVDTLLFGSSRENKKADYGAAELYLANGNTEQALREYKKIVSRFPKEIPAYLQAIRLCRQLGREEEAEKLYNTALRRISSEQDRNLFIGSVRRMTAE